MHRVPVINGGVPKRHRSGFRTKRIRK